MNNEHQRLYALTEHILGLMQSNAGAISLQSWMQAALYAPKLGYYESEQVFGKGGDFTTATAMGDWLALGFAETIHKSWQALGEPMAWTLVEQGGGSGDLLVNTLRALADLKLQPSHIIAVEKSEQLRTRQHELYSANNLDVQQVSSLQDIATIERAVFISNELPDAFPVQSFVYQGGKTIERGVDWDGEKFTWQNLSEINTGIPDAIQQHWAEGYISECNPYLKTWQQDIANLFEQGIVLTVDYGYTRQEYYRATRIEGTLMGHYQHQVVEDVLQLSPGLCDITAHVDFTALKHAGEAVGLHTVAYITQGAWLAQTEAIQHHIQSLASQPSVENIAQISHAKRLMLPNGMGESFKLMIQSKGLSEKSSVTLRSPAFDRSDKL
ncbi:MAG: SAM-dependent methyltransferase [Ghiorsea sp.]